MESPLLIWGREIHECSAPVYFYYDSSLNVPPYLSTDSLTYLDRSKRRWMVFSYSREFNSGYAQEQTAKKKGNFEFDPQVVCSLLEDVTLLEDAQGDGRSKASNSRLPTVTARPEPKAKPVAAPVRAPEPEPPVQAKPEPTPVRIEVKPVAAPIPEPVIQPAAVVIPIAKEVAAPVVTTPVAEPVREAISPADVAVMIGASQPPPAPSHRESSNGRALRNVENPVFLHGTITKADADALLAGKDNGKCHCLVEQLNGALAHKMSMIALTQYYASQAVSWCADVLCRMNTCLASFTLGNPLII